MADNIPISPAVGGVSVAQDSLLPADIIVSTTAARVSGAIRKITGSVVSHASVYIGNGELIEAIGEGVIRRTLDIAIAQATLAVALRRRGITDGAADQVVRFAESNVGKKYDYAGLAGAGAKSHPGVACLISPLGCYAALHGAFSSSNKFYCSELVLEAFRQADLPIIDDRSDTSVPDDIVQAFYSHQLDFVGHLVG